MTGRFCPFVVALAVGFASLCAGADEQSAPPPSEEQLAATLRDDPDWANKDAASRVLRQIATARSVPVLAALLEDEQLGHLARYVLEPMTHPSAGKALRDAIARTAGSPKAGVIISLGARRDAQAAASIAPALLDEDLDVARAAAGALGRIATPAAIGALMDARANAPEAIHHALAEGLLAAGDRLVQLNRGSQAVPIYESLLVSFAPMHVRLGAFRGLAQADPSKAPDRLLAAIAGNDAAFRNLAAQIIGESANVAVTKRYADALPGLGEAGQVALLRGLAGRKDPRARPAVLNALECGIPAVRLAAVNALASIGGAQDVPVLVKLLAADEAAVAAASQSGLAGLEGKGVDEAIAGAMHEAAPSVRPVLLALLADRMAPQAAPLAMAALGYGDGPARIAALNALAKLGTKDEAPAVIGAMKEASEAAERTAAADALGAIASVQQDEVLPMILGGMEGASAEVKTILLRTLARIGSAGALEHAIAALQDAALRPEAMKTVAAWPSAAAAPHLLDLARSDEANRSDMLRAYVRWAREERDPQAKTTMLTAAMDLAGRPEDKWIVLAGWATLATPQALGVLRPLLDDASVQNESAAAIVSVSNELAKQGPEGKALAVEALNDVLQKCTNDGIKDRAQRALAPLKG